MFFVRFIVTAGRRYCSPQSVCLKNSKYPKNIFNEGFPRTKNYTITKETANHLLIRFARIKLDISVGFHTSSSRHNPSPDKWQLILEILRRLVPAAGVALQQNISQLRPGTIAAVGGIVTLSGYLFYLAHLEECPITKRKKFVIFSEYNITSLARQESDNVLRQYRGKVTRNGEVFRNVSGICANILKANKHLPGTKKKWRVFILEDRRMNAFVLPNGDIFIFSGMIAAVGSDDQLAAVMGHEIAHALLNHAGELISKTQLLQLLMLIPLIIIWAKVPEMANFTEYITEIVFKLPMSRQLETEADTVGLKMMARACYDPRQAVELWKRMAKLAQGAPIVWLSTHPSHKTRYNTLEKLMPEAMGIYTAHCK